MSSFTLLYGVYCMMIKVQKASGKSMFLIITYLFSTYSYELISTTNAYTFYINVNNNELMMFFINMQCIYSKFYHTEVIAKKNFIQNAVRMRRYKHVWYVDAANLR